MKYTCVRTGKISRSFEYPSDYDAAREYEYPVLIKRFFNGCQLRECTPIPDGGDCGFSLMSSIALIIAYIDIRCIIRNCDEIF